MDRKLVKTVGAWVLATCVIASPFIASAAGLVPCGDFGDGEKACSYKDFVILINTLINFLIVYIALPISALLFAWAGFLMITAAGDEGKIKRGKEIFADVFWGLILALAAWMIINLIVNILTGGKGLNDLLG